MLTESEKLEAARAYIADSRELAVNLGDLGCLTQTEEALRGIACLALADLLCAVERRQAGKL